MQDARGEEEEAGVSHLGLVGRAASRAGSTGSTDPLPLGGGRAG
jgi:hypothetical protein